MKKEKLEKPLKLLAKTSLIVFIGLFFAKVFAYIYRIVIARYFGPDIYGLFSLSMMVVGWFVAVSSFGLSTGIVRYASIYRGKNEIDKIKYIFKRVSLILLISSIISALLLFFLSDYISIKIFNDPGLIIFLKILSFTIPGFVLSSMLLSFVRGFERIKAYSYIMNVFQNFIKVFSIIILILIGVKTNAVIFSYLLAIFLTLLLSYIYCRNKLPLIFMKYNLKSKEKQEIMKSLISYSWPIMFFGIVNTVLYWIDSFSIGYFRTTAEVGIYNAAIPLALLLGFVPELFMQLFFPLITKEYAKKNFSLIRQLSKQVGKWIFLINLPIFLVMIIFPGSVISLLFGEQYVLAKTALRFLLISSLFSSVFIVSNNLVSMIGKSKLSLMNITLASVLNLVLNIFLVPRYGINGAAFSTMISLIFFSLLFIIQANHYTSIIPLRRKMIRILIVTLVPILILIAFKNTFSTNLVNQIFFIFLFFVSYFALIILTGCLDKNDLMILSAVKKKIFNKINS